MLTPDQVREWLGAPRFGRYLTAASGDAGRALALYEWNSRLAAAALRDVGHFEVAMRNAYDAQLSERYPEWAADPTSGLFRLETGPAKDRVPQRQLNAGSAGKLSAARAGLGGRPTHGQVVAALDFGFWAQLSRRRGPTPATVGELGDGRRARRGERGRPRPATPPPRTVSRAAKRTRPRAPLGR